MLRGVEGDHRVVVHLLARQDRAEAVPGCQHPPLVEEAATAGTPAIRVVYLVTYFVAIRLSLVTYPWAMRGNVSGQVVSKVVHLGVITGLDEHNQPQLGQLNQECDPSLKTIETGVDLGE